MCTMYDMFNVTVAWRYISMSIYPFTWLSHCHCRFCFFFTRWSFSFLFCDFFKFFLNIFNHSDVYDLYLDGNHYSIGNVQHIKSQNVTLKEEFTTFYVRVRYLPSVEMEAKTIWSGVKLVKNHSSVVYLFRKFMLNGELCHLQGCSACLSSRTQNSGAVSGSASCISAAWCSSWMG